MSFSIDCLTPHPPSPSKRLIHSRRFALSERDSRLPHAPAPRGRRQPRTGGAGPGDFITPQAELSTGRIHRLVHGCGGLWDVAILPVRNAGSRPPHWASTPAEAPGPGRHAPWDRIPRYRVLAENPGIPSDQSHSHSRESRGRPSTAATAHSSSSCNLSAVTSGSPERAIAPPSPQFYTGARRICG